MSEELIEEAEFIKEMVDHFDHHDPRLAREGMPQKVYKELRAKWPMQWTDSYGGFWIASKFAEVERVATDSAHFCSSKGLNIPDPTDALPVEGKKTRFAAGKDVVDPPAMYDPAHTAIRRAVEPLFASALVRRRVDYIRNVANDIIDTFIEAGECDAFERYCAPIPAIVALDWLGLDANDWKGWSDAVVSQFNNPGEHEPDFSAIDLTKILVTLNERKRNPTDDVLTAVTQTRVDGELLNDLDMLMMVAQMVFAGLDTTTTTIGGTLVELYRRPEIRAELACTAHDSQLWDSAIEEFLRYTVPVQGFKRTARETAEVGNQTVNPGERVFILWASANFDEEEFDKPFEIDIRRTANKHMSFGRGVHCCPGSHLARLEMKVMIQEFLKRMPEYRVDEAGLQLHQDVGLSYGYQHIPVTFAPGPVLGDGSIRI